MFQRQFVLEPASNGDYPLHITAKQYWSTEVLANWEDPDAFTLIVLHSTSFHKETWESTLQHFLGGGIQSGRTSPKIRCAWVIECPNHGESAALNNDALQRPPFYRAFGCEKYAEAVHRFMSSGPALPTPVDFRRQKLIGIGHSLGGVVISILPTLEPVFNFSALVLVEPLLSPGGMGNLHELKSKLIRGAYERRDVWASREDALRYLRPRTSWDPRVLDLYVKHGLRIHQAPKHHSGPYHGVTLACSRDEEVTMYSDPTGSDKGLQAIDDLCVRIPVSVIFGDDNDYIPRSVQDALVDPASGRCFRTVTRIKGVGHLIPQHLPENLSEVLLDVLRTLTAPAGVSKL
jgi:alpha-beta hydrolase superfamily lysophospholipase